MKISAKIGIAALALVACVLAFSSPLRAQQTLEEIQQQQTQLQQQLKDIEKQIASYEQQIKTVQSQKNTLANKLKQLNAQRAKIQLQIQESQALIKDTTRKLDQTQGQIAVQQDKLARLQEQMGEVVQELYKQDRRTLIDILLSGDNLSDFFGELNGYERINDGLSAIAAQVKVETDSLEAQKAHLADQKQQQQNFFSIIQLQNQELTGTIKDQDTLLQETKGKEAAYQNQLADQKQQAAAIRNRMYTLLELGKQITFGQAVAVAQWASAQTGVRAAFLLGILTQESNLGSNVGTCNRLNDPPSKSWRVVMKPDRDQAPFQQITSALNLPIDTTPISCPMHDANGNQIGWGGAMGPAQFIPSTWLGYAGKISAITGKTANPWDIRDAFLAASLKLKADGGGTQSGEWAAAMKYFSGSTNLAYRFYGDNVVKLATQYQSDIDQLNK